jgi:uncharacterized glyoxalase superfamily protein PhnB
MKTDTQSQATSSTKTNTKPFLVPHLTCKNAIEAVEFYRKAFGAEVHGVFQTADGKVMHASLTIGDSMLYLVDEFPAYGGLGPKSIGGSPVALHLQVPDCDAVFQRALDAGCEMKMPLEDMFWGDRYGAVVDPFGHVWSIATTVREVSPEELREIVANMPGC